MPAAGVATRRRVIQQSLQPAVLRSEQVGMAGVPQGQEHRRTVVAALARAAAAAVGAARAAGGVDRGHEGFELRGVCAGHDRGAGRCRRVQHGLEAWRRCTAQSVQTISTVLHTKMHTMRALRASKQAATNNS